MKYAILQPNGRVSLVTDKPRTGAVEITDEQAAKISEVGRGAFLIEGEVKTLSQFMESTRRAAMTPEQLAAEQARLQRQAAYDAAAAIYDAMPAGKRALWEPVRQKVASALLSGDFAGAKEILETLPALYDGAEAERQQFLALFP